VVIAMTANRDTSQLLQKALEHHRAGRRDTAEKGYRGILKVRPHDPDALHLLGVLMGERGHRQKASDLITQALKVRDDFPDAHYNMALHAIRGNDLTTAEHHLRRALHYRPIHAPTHHHLGLVFSHRSLFAQAEESLRTAISQDHRFIDSYLQLARVQRTTNDINGMLTTVQAGMAVAPQHPTLWLMAAEACFALGKLKEGWNCYRWRFQSVENPVAAKTYALPLWQGESLAEKAILVWGEQAPGDEVMYANMLPDVIATAKRCVIQCSPRLTALIRRSFPKAEVRDRDLTADELKSIDVQSPVASLGEWLRPDFTTFPRHTGYLRADPALREQLRAKYAAGGNPCVVGISWRSAGVINDTDKSVGLLDWGPILHVPGVTFVNLQYGDCAIELDTAVKGFGVSIIRDSAVDPLKDLDAFAAQVAAMDMVISSSNTAAHFAGALGVPALCMLPMSLGRGRRWYWFAESGACPWYPSTQIFLQRHEGQWLDVIRDAGLCLLDFASARSGTKRAPYLRSMAPAFANAGRPDDAVHLYKRLAQEPGLAGEGLWLAAGVKRNLGQNDESLAFLEQAIAQDPGYWPAYNEKGVLLVTAGRIDDAIACYREGLTHNPDAAEIHNNLGSALQRHGHSGEALMHFQRADALRPDVPQIHVNLAAALEETGDTDAALREIDEAIRLRPDHADGYYNKAQIALSAGRFVEGWTAFTWRLKRAGANVQHAYFPQPIWNGESLAGKSILVWTEQGLGDEILTASIMPDAIAAAGHVTILCSGRMVPLMQRSFPTATVENLNPVIRRFAPDATDAERAAPMPPAAVNPRIDLQMSLAELGLAFRRSFADFPARRRFLLADPARRDALRAKYQSLRPGARVVGISWRSRRGDEFDRLKSQELLAWAPILATPDVLFVNLQYGDCGEELAQARAQLGVEILADAEIDPLKDMDGFAAQVAAMDLVISVSNTTVHTAGGQGVPVWVLLREGRGRIWYWFRDRFDSPWYPSARLMRQKTSGDWQPVIDGCASELKTLVEQPLSAR